jgi:hypothetical protein
MVKGRDGINWGFGAKIWVSQLVNTTAWRSIVGKEGIRTVQYDHMDIREGGFAGRPREIELAYMAN